MARLARPMVAGVGHHVTQRGNRRQRVFFGDSDAQLAERPENWRRSSGRAHFAGRDHGRVTVAPLLA